jgi:hypothetical protein
MGCDCAGDTALSSIRFHRRRPVRVLLPVMRSPAGAPPILWSYAVPEYRAYLVGHDGHFTAAVPLVCPDDETAKEQAKQLVDGHDVELWQKARKVAVFEHKSFSDGEAG